MFTSSLCDNKGGCSFSEGVSFILSKVLDVDGGEEQFKQSCFLERVA